MVETSVGLDRLCSWRFSQNFNKKKWVRWSLQEQFLLSASVLALNKAAALTHWFKKDGYQAHNVNYR